jgi:hypothetical protein
MLLDAAEIDPATTVLETALAGLPTDGADDVRARLLADLARADFRADRNEAALTHAEAALTIAERLGLDDVIADAFNNRAAALSYLGRRREAQALLAAAVEVAHRAGLLGTELRARNNVAATMWVDDPVQSTHLDRITAEESRRAGIRNNVQWLMGNIAYAVLLEGTGWDETIAEIDELIADRELTGLTLRLVPTRAWFGAIRGEPVDEAIAITERQLQGASAPETRLALLFVEAARDLVTGDLVAARDRLVSVSAADWDSLVLFWAIHPILWLGDLGGARTLIERIDASADARSTVMNVTRLSTQAGIAALEGRSDDAIALFSEARAAFETIEWRLMRALVAIDAIALLGPDEPAARDMAADAREVLVGLRVAPFVARIDAILDGSIGPLAPRAASPTAIPIKA